MPIAMTGLRLFLFALAAALVPAAAARSDDALPLTFSLLAAAPAAHGASAPTPAPPPSFNPEAAAASPGPWYAEAMYGALNPDNFTTIMFAPYKTEMTGNDIVGFGAGREIFDLGAGFSVELGLQFYQRIDEGGSDIGMPITMVFDGFPWRDRLPMRLRLAVGPSYTTSISDNERRKDDDNEGSKLLNMFNPEIEVGWPGAPEWAGFFRLHHRSGIFGLINGVTGGSTYLTVGLRHRFAVE